MVIDFKTSVIIYAFVFVLLAAVVTDTSGFCDKAKERRLNDSLKIELTKLEIQKLKLELGKN